MPEITDRTSSKNNKRMGLRQSLSSMNSTASSYWGTKAELLQLELEEMDERYTASRNRTSTLSGIYLQSHEQEFLKRRNALEELVLGALQKEHELEMALESAAQCSNGEQAERAFVQLLLLHYIKNPKSQKSNFRRDVEDYYGTLRVVDNDDAEEEQTENWCPVTQAWASCHRKAAHLIPQRIRQKGMDLIFGEESMGEMYSPRNGLMLESQVEKHFDHLQLAIVPCKDDSNDFELRVIDKGLCKMIHVESRCSFGDMHGKKLKFLNANRPRERYLYFHWMICMALASSKPINQERVKNERERHQKFWGTPGRWVREEMIRGLIKHTGHDLPVDHTIPEEGKDVTELVEEICKPYKRKEDDEEDDEENDEDS
ncbi:uncharacterized protein EAE97_009408 [Botrytis byssoidea]|uniref:HNH nuclease domain-containing protein n=1 Tax=Botrytis byssoidea TaxID=139641 RepID=A0A9P5I518_9HELO|nr:uncharacterized protein EAE97_009408 [Botrytis byssoidea]KAF7929811.1 hypothetical protein EAE97_009408 [Botrytis byssoidea]